MLLEAEGDVDISEHCFFHDHRDVLGIQVPSQKVLGFLGYELELRVKWTSALGDQQLYIHYAMSMRFLCTSSAALDSAPHFHAGPVGTGIRCGQGPAALSTEPEPLAGPEGH